MTILIWEAIAMMLLGYFIIGLFAFAWFGFGCFLLAQGVLQSIFKRGG